MQHRPGRLVRADLKRPLQALAEIPYFWVANQAVNHTVDGVRVLSKIVPAVGDVRPSHSPQRNRPSAIRQPTRCPQSGQANPSGQRTHSR